MDAVREVLEEIGAGDVPELLVFNKADQGDGSERLAEKYEEASPFRPTPASTSNTSRR